MRRLGAIVAGALGVALILGGMWAAAEALDLYLRCRLLCGWP